MMTTEQQLRLEAFKLASLMGDNHSTQDLIRNAELIYQSITK